MHAGKASNRFYKKQNALSSCHRTYFRYGESLQTYYYPQRIMAKDDAHSTEKSTDKASAARAKNLDLAIQQIAKDYGDGAIMIWE